MNVLSLFDGMSIGLQSLKKKGIKVDNYFSSEIEESSIIVSNANHPEIIRLGDVTKWKEWDLPKIDLIIGGSPCQGFSRQGIGLNFDDPRSKLFFEFVDIVNYYKELNNDVKFMLENVDMQREWQDTISDYLKVEPIKINSDNFLPQNRPRTYWANFPIKQVDKKEYKLLDLLQEVELENYTEKGHIKICNTFSENSIKLVNVINGEVRIKQAVKVGYAVAEPGDGINISFPTSKSRRGRVIKNRTSCLDTACNIGVYDKNNQIRRLTINEMERLQGLPDGYTSWVSDSQAKKMLGNGWTVDVISHILGGLI